MNLIETENRTEELIQQLTALWEGSVRATHLFLSPEEITEIKKYVPQAVGFYTHMGFRLARRTEVDEQGHPYPILYMKLDA